jgi:hypothetical protein
MSTIDRLAPNARQALALSNEERIRFILEERWVGYTKANEIVARLEDLLVHPKIGRMPNMLITGKTNNGKSHLVKHFRDLHPATDNPAGEGIRVPVLYVEAPDKPVISHLYATILDTLFVPRKANEKEMNLQSQVIDVLKRIDLGIIVIDEMNNLIAGSPISQRAFLNSIKYLGNQLQRSIVGVGTAEVLIALQVDKQLSNRFLPAVLPTWQMDMEFLRLLASLEKMLPLKSPSSLTEKTMAMKVHAMSEGTIGELSLLLNTAAIWAIRNTKDGKPECIDKAALDGCGYISSSNRRSEANKV